MFRTALRLAALAVSQVRGSPINPCTVRGLIVDARATLMECGSLGQRPAELLGPLLREEERQEYQRRAFERTLRHLEASPFYRDRLASLPRSFEQRTCLPLTRRHDLRDASRVLTSIPALATRTTGTTETPLEVYYSSYECELWPALAALGMLLRGEDPRERCFQLNVRLRATAAVQLHIEMCRLFGAPIHVLGLVSPDESLDCLLRADQPVTDLHTYASYLARLVQQARRRGLSPRDFHLSSIQIVGEMLTPGLSAACQRLFGIEPVDVYNATEIQPMSGQLCDCGHLHFDPQLGLVECLAVSSNTPAPAGSLARLIVTPFYPYRSCMPLLRYDTGDLVWCLAEQPMTCNLAGFPATSPVAGKAEQLLVVQGRVLTPRTVHEVLEALPSEPFPARYVARVAHDGLELTVSERVLDGLTEREVRCRFQEAGIPVQRLCLLPEGEMIRRAPVRADMVEASRLAERSGA